MPDSYFAAKDPARETAGLYYPPNKSILLNENFKNNVPWTRVTPAVTSGHEFGHLSADLAGGAQGTNINAAGNFHNYYVTPGERLARVAGVYADTPAKDWVHIPPSVAFDLADAHPQLYDPAFNLGAGTPSGAVNPVSTQRLNQVRALQELYSNLYK
jgi:hypothetical protein